MQSSDFGGAFSNWDFSVFAIGGIVLLVIALVLFGLVFWALGLIARGGMISAVDDLESGKPDGIRVGSCWESASCRPYPD